MQRSILRPAFGAAIVIGGIFIIGAYFTFAAVQGDFGVVRRVQIVAEYDAVVHSQRQEFRIPSVVVLKEFVRPQKRVAFTRFNLFLRDEFCCQYCGAKGDLTFDHVLPRSKGGITSWENVVAACSPCNLRKGGRTPEQAGMALLRPAIRPKWTPMFRNAAKPQTYREWLPFLSVADASYWNVELKDD